MAAHKGNNYATKLKTKEDKDKVYKDYCEHIAKGRSHKSWYYDKDNLKLTWVSIENYIKEDKDFDPYNKEIAISKALGYWEKLGFRMMVGEIEKCQPAIYQMNMRNRFGWDRETQTREESKGVFNKWLGKAKE